MVIILSLIISGLIVLLIIISILWLRERNQGRSVENSGISDGLAAGYFFNFLKPLIELLEVRPIELTTQNEKYLIENQQVKIFIIVPPQINSELFQQEQTDVINNTIQLNANRINNRSIIFFGIVEPKELFIYDVPTTLLTVLYYRDVAVNTQIPEEIERGLFVQTLENLLNELSLPQNVEVIIQDSSNLS